MIEIHSDRVRSFYQLSIDKSFSKASESLGISQPGLSQKIALLEEELETTLVIRTTKSLKITESGQKLVQYYKIKKDLDEELIKDLLAGSKEVQGELRIAGYSSIVRSALIPCLSSLIGKYKFKFNILSQEIYTLEEALLSGQVDFIISTNEIKRENVINQEIGIEENIHIVPLKEGVEMPFLDHDEKDTTTFDFFKIQNKIKKYNRCYLGDIYNILQGVELGVGQAIISKHLVKSNLKVKQKRYRNRMKSKIYLCYFRRPYYSNLYKIVISNFEEKFSKYL